MKNFLFVWELVKVVLISAAIIIPIRHFLIQPFFVKGDSMEPNFLDKEYLIDELSYRLLQRSVGNNCFRYPRDPQEYFIKRLIGLPGEQVQIKDGQVIIFNNEYPEGMVLTENYLPENLETFSDSEEKLPLAQMNILF